MRLPGDELVPERPMLIMNHAITIDAPPEKIFPYFVQLGQDRAGFYSYDWLERLSGFGIYNTYQIRPEWQSMKAGDFVTFHKAGMGMRVASVDPGKTIVLITDSRERGHRLPADKWEFFPVPEGKYVAWNWIFHLDPLPDGRTRVYSRTYANWSSDNPFLNLALANAFELPSDVMDRRMLLSIKQMAERDR
ncbi:MAG TPA: SRPBCC family protein [Candidatus Saccharimonadales bacterium]|nr:SRPBCC family protein [Candidatus Saccharimonadales bacterium]